MNHKIILKRDNTNFKKPFHLKNNIFLIYSPKNIKVKPGEFQRIDSGILSFLPTSTFVFLHQNLEKVK